LEVILMRDDLVRTNIVLPKELKEELREKSKNTHFSMSQYIRMALEREMEENEDSVLRRLEIIEKKIDQIEEELKKETKNEF